MKLNEVFSDHEVMTLRTNSIERLIDQTVNVLKTHKRDDVRDLAHDWQDFRPLLIRLWNEAGSRTYE